MTVSGKDKRELVEKLRTLRTRLDRLERRNAELVHVEQELRESLEQFKTIFDNTLVGLYRTTPDGRILMANSVVVNMLGYSSFDELARRNLENDGYEPQYPRSVFKERIEREGKVIGLESAWNKSDGTTLYVRESAQAVRDESGKTLYYQGTVEDITEHRQTKRALHESEELFVSLAANLSEGVDIVDENLCCLFANPAGEKIFGVEPGGLVGRNLHEFVSDQSHAPLEKERSKRREGIASSYDLEIIRPDGQKRQLIVTASPRLSEDGKYVGALAFFFDVTGRKQAEDNLRKAHDELEMRVQERTAELQQANEALQAEIAERVKTEHTLIASELQYRTTLDSMGDAIHVVDSELRVVLLNERFRTWSEELGFEVDHPDGRMIFEMFPFLPETVGDEYRRVFEEGRVLTTEEVTRIAGREIATETRKIPIRQEDRVVRVVTVVRDITERRQAEDRLAEAELRYRTVADFAYDWEYWESPDGSLRHVSPSCERITGYAPEQFIGNPDLLSELVWPEDRPIWDQHHRESIKTPKSREVQFRIRRRDGQVCWIEHTCQPVTGVNGTFLGFRGSNREITERKAAEKALRESEAALMSIFRAAPVGIGLECDRVLSRVNDQICAMLGYSRDELVGKNARMFYPGEEDYQRTRNEKHRQIRERGTATVETRWKHKDGRIIDILLSTTVLDAADFSKGVAFTALDVTERKRAEEALKESEEKFRSLAEQSPNMIFINKKGRIVYANKRCEEIMGYPREQLYSPDFSFLSLIAPESVEMIKELFARHLRGEDLRPYDYSLIDKQGRRIEAINSSKLIHYEGQTAILGIVTDITEHKKAEGALRESQERLKILFESAPDAVYVTDLEGRFVDGNRAAEEMVGFTKAELIGKSLAESGLLPVEDLSKAAANVQRIACGQPSGPTEYTVRRKSGSLIAVEVRAFPVRIAGKTLSLAIARDITARKHAEEALRASEKKFRSIFETAANLITSINEQGIIVDCNDRVREFLGYEKEEILGRSMARIIHPDYLDKAQNALKEILSKGFSYNKEYKMVRKDGSLIDVSINSSAIEDEHGRCARTLCIIDDITDRKRAQQRLLDDREQLKSLASQLSLTEDRERHRLATMLHDHISQSLVISKIKLDQMRKSESASGLTGALNDVSRCLGQIIQETRTLTFDLSYPILYELGFEAAVAEWLTEQIQEKHGIETEFQDDGQAKPLDEDIRALLFRNVRELLINIVKHAQAQHVKISVTRADDSIRVSVEDDGVGFDPAGVAAMAAKRAEFGLFSIRERLEQLGGHIEIESKPGRGTKITMTAPLRYEHANDGTQK